MTGIEQSPLLKQQKYTLPSIAAIMLAVYMALLPFEYVLSGESGTINKYVGILVIGCCLVSRSFSYKLKKNNIKIFLFIMFGAISILWAISHVYWKDVFLSYLKNAALFFVVAQCRFTRRESRFVLYSSVVGALFLLVYLIFSPNVMVDAFSGRTVISTNDDFFDPNYMAADILVPIGFMCGVFFDNLKKRKFLKVIVALIVILLIFYIEILSGSRGGLVAILVMFLSITIMNFKSHDVRRKIIIVLLCGIILFSVVSNLLPEQIMERFTLESLLGQSDSGGGRLVLWDAAWQGIKKKFILGYGAGCAIPAVGMFHGINRASHSLYLSSVLEFGVASLLLYSAILSEMRKAYRKRLYTEVGISIGVLVASIFLDSLSTKFFWAFLVILFIRNSAVTSYGKKN